MNILFHVGSGNTDRPSRWWGVCVHFSNLARSFESLGHECVLQVHPKAVSANIFHRFELSEVAKDSQCNPDVVFTWNGISPGDKAIIDLHPNAIPVYAELGFFDHYETVYFDFSGTNSRSMNLLEDIDKEFNGLDEEIFNRVKRKYAKYQLINDYEYVFVPLQDNLDTQITKYSPFNNMTEFMDWVLDVTKFMGPEVKIVYKQHPMAPTPIKADPRLIEVKDDVHHYLENANFVIGCNSSVLFECLLYHNRIITAGIGLTSRPLNEEDRKAYIIHCYKKQIHQTKLGDPNYIKETWMYKELLKKV